jgi:hypothetical protein
MNQQTSSCLDGGSSCPCFPVQNQSKAAPDVTLTIDAAQPDAWQSVWNAPSTPHALTALSHFKPASFASLPASATAAQCTQLTFQLVHALSSSLLGSASAASSPTTASTSLLQLLAQTALRSTRAPLLFRFSPFEALFCSELCVLWYVCV